MTTRAYWAMAQKNKLLSDNGSVIGVLKNVFGDFPRVYRDRDIDRLGAVIGTIKSVCEDVDQQDQLSKVLGVLIELITRHGEIELSIEQ